ncbi:MHYT domain-containing protein [Nitratireductor luteus]|uniref:MHYT domain-containing protein n=1 Tax=Nitratireductor luteus TaxID=2976980 RepID=UPI00223F086B|nr:MHYT domain-containing protein [Nitratireductor luteus]
MFVGHNPFLVALSVVIAILGGYTGFGLAARVRDTGSAGRRLLLAGAAFFLAVGVWTMHFVGMLAAPIPLDATYLILPTIISFLICALVMGVSLFFVSLDEPSNLRIVASALLLGLGIVSMHYVGIHGLAGAFHLEHQHTMMLAAAVIAVGTAYGGLRIFLARHDGMRLALSAAAFGIAVSGMHYTAMYEMRFLPGPPLRTANGLAASPEVLAVIVSLLCFIIIFGFLLFLVPEPQSRALMSASAHETDTDAFDTTQMSRSDRNGFGSARAQTPLPTGMAPVTRLPVEGADGTHFVEVGRIRSIRANSHYTLIHDGSRERMCPWAISHAEAHLDPATFMRVHRSHIVSIRYVSLIRKEGDSAVVELDGEVPHLVPVSRVRIAELRARLGLIRRSV